MGLCGCFGGPTEDGPQKIGAALPSQVGNKYAVVELNEADSDEAMYVLVTSFVSTPEPIVNYICGTEHPLPRSEESQAGEIAEKRAEIVRGLLRWSWTTCVTEGRCFGIKNSRGELMAVAACMPPGTVSGGIVDTPIRSARVYKKAGPPEIFGQRTKDRYGPRPKLRAEAVGSTTKLLHGAVAPGSHWYLYSLAVLPDHQGTGLGTVLLEAIAHMAQTDDVPLYLEAGASNSGYYLSRGFTNPKSMEVVPPDVKIAPDTYLKEDSITIHALTLRGSIQIKKVPREPAHKPSAPRAIPKPAAAEPPSPASPPPPSPSERVPGPPQAKPSLNWTTNRSGPKPPIHRKSLNTQMLKVIISGAPAAGKGTQSALIVKEFGILHLSTGDILRNEVETGTDIGKIAKEYMDRGDLVPDQVIVKMVRKRLQRPDTRKAHGWLLDGFPRTASQALALDANSIRPHVFILLEVPDEVALERAAGRRLDPETGTIYHLTHLPPPEEAVGRLEQRSDDKDEKKMLNRLKLYNTNLPSVRSKYESVIKPVDGNRPIATVFDEIKEVIYATKGTIALSALGPSIIKKPPLRVIMSGPPASGKGTQCDLLVKEFRFTHIGVGDLLRLEVACESEIGRKAKEYMEAGNLVPDEVIIKMVKLRLAQTDCIENGFLLDGFPLSLSQAVALDNSGIRPHAFISLRAPDATLVERATNRRLDPVNGNRVYNLLTCPPPEEIKGRLIQRKDDKPETIGHRLAQFAKYSDIIREKYEDVSLDIDGAQRIATVFAQISEHLHDIQDKLPPLADNGKGTGPLHVLLAGAPGAGKGTQGRRAAEQFGLLHFSTGDLLREEVKKGSMVGRRAKSYIDNGDLVPDDTVTAIIRKRLTQPDAVEQGWILDGFPLTAAQVAALALAGIEPDVFFDLQVPGDVLAARIVGRRVDTVTAFSYHVEFMPPPPEVAERCVQRAEDREELVEQRLVKYNDCMESVRAKYTHISVPIDGDRTPDEVQDDIANVIMDLRPQRFPRLSDTSGGDAEGRLSNTG